MVLIEHMLNHSSDSDLGFLGLPDWRAKAGFELFELLSGAAAAVLVLAAERFLASRASLAASASCHFLAFSAGLIFAYASGEYLIFLMWVHASISAWVGGGPFVPAGVT